MMKHLLLEIAELVGKNLAKLWLERADSRANQAPPQTKHLQIGCAQQPSETPCCDRAAKQRRQGNL